MASSHYAIYKETNKASVKRAAAAYRVKIGILKTQLGCADCGYSEHPAALDFDHLPQYEKKFLISKGWQRTWASVEDEIAKCEVVCANCHRIRTYNRNR